MDGGERLVVLVIFGGMLSLVLVAGVITGGALVNDAPDPVITDVTISDDEITEGEPVEIRVEARNDGGTADVDSTISLSFPDLGNSGDTDAVSIVSKSTTHGYSDIVAPGDEIWDRNAESLDTEYVLVKAGTIGL